MLVLSRKLNEGIWLTTADGTRVRVFVANIGSDKVRLGFDAPLDVRIDRDEIDVLRRKNGQS